MRRCCCRLYLSCNRWRSFYGNAKELHTVNAMPKGWKVVENTRDYVPPICAIAIYTKGVYSRWGTLA